MSLPDCVTALIDQRIKTALQDFGILDEDCLPIGQQHPWCRDFTAACGFTEGDTSTCDDTDLGAVINSVTIDLGDVASSSAFSIQVEDCDTGQVLAGPYAMPIGQMSAAFTVADVSASERRIGIAVLSGATTQAVSINVCGVIL